MYYFVKLFVYQSLNEIMEILFWIIVATIIDSLIALVGIFSLWLSDVILDRFTFLLISLSAGTLLSGALFHLIPESLEVFTIDFSFSLLIVGFVLFFLIEKFLHWHHCHKRKCDIHPVSLLILIGDGIHNFIDGLVITASFLVSIPFGIITTLIIISHEIPQELGDFAVLLFGGLKKKSALIYNFISQLTCILGGITGYYVSNIYNFSPLMLPIAAGGFLYIATSDLIPELRKETNMKKSLTSFFFFILGILTLIVIKHLAGMYQP